MGLCSSAPGAQAVRPAREPERRLAPSPPIRVPAILRAPGRIKDEAISSLIPVLRAGLDRLDTKLQKRIDAHVPTSARSDADFTSERSHAMVMVRATDLQGLLQSVSSLLELSSFKRAANQASAAAANRDTLRQLGDMAGRARRGSATSMTKGHAVDADIANYVLDEFASTKQLSAADSRFRMGISAVDRLLSATGRIASEAVGKQVEHASRYLADVAPSLSEAQRTVALDMVGEVGEWDLDVLSLEAAVTFPAGLQAARHRMAAASAVSVPGMPSPIGSGGGDGLEGMHRLALPFLGSVLLRRHGFLLATGELPEDATAAARIAMTAVSLRRSVDVTHEGGDAAGGASSGARRASASPAALPDGEALDSLLLPESRSIPFLRRLADGYLSNPYHSATHAIDVMYTAHCVLLSPHLHGVMRREHRLAILLGAALHDFRHDGLNNALHAKLHSPLALRYNDISVLESMHVSEAYALMRSGNGELDLLDALSPDQQRRLREAMVETVLATDMRFHFKALEEFEVNVLPIVRRYHAERTSVISEARTLRRNQQSGAISLGFGVSGPAAATAGRSRTQTPQAAKLALAVPSEASVEDDATSAMGSPRRSSAVGSAVAATIGASLAARYRFGGKSAASAPGDANKRGGARKARLSVVSAPVAELQQHSMVIAKLTLHAADVSNPVKPLAVYRKWAARCMSEFYHVGDCERHEGLPVSTFFDRTNRSMPKCQIGFISFIVRPLFAALSELVDDYSDEWRTALDENHSYFEARVLRGERDDEPCDGDWFEFTPGEPRPGASFEDPFREDVRSAALC
ncbi:hypothetical protein FNF29_06329 [Cafeteria roenbergensis]|uniref:Phosphodiesterase n=1 Tax=Cafeteria roenbergensis TaxID=33653 RepID=A0A5A8C8A9_CAFRO|nr:hypothetical protein FNF29_06329 [Cafeteria roenbergensis]KAA0171053.1 hypothetical protein FNF28_01058 [Cafeteria roenbergensis]|eukprot:KAA0149038.1 hypothetical protein FNF29_06329 [Cafeteria roenbergensis]